MKNVFVSNNKTISITDGNLQFNTSAPEFRNRIQLFADGINKMNDKRLYYSECVRTAEKSLALYNKGTYVDSTVVESKEKEIEDYKQAVSDITAEIQKAMPTYNDIDKNLYYAYKQYVAEEIDYATYERAFAEWLDNAGIAPTHKGISFIVGKVGVKKASARTMCKNKGTDFTAAMSEKQYLDLIYRVVATLMYKANALKPYTYDYVIPSKKNTTK